MEHHTFASIVAGKIYSILFRQLGHFRPNIAQETLNMARGEAASHRSTQNDLDS